jgi:hypothetical protein
MRRPRLFVQIRIKVILLTGDGRPSGLRRIDDVSTNLGGTGHVAEQRLAGPRLIRRNKLGDCFAALGDDDRLRATWSMSCKHRALDSPAGIFMALSMVMT